MGIRMLFRKKSVGIDPTCSWGPCYGRSTPAVAAIVVGRIACGHLENPTASCQGCVAVLQGSLRDSAQRSSPCPQCGVRSEASIFEVIDLDSDRDRP